jgi:hypothetical protein
MKTDTLDIIEIIGHKIVCGFFGFSGSADCLPLRIARGATPTGADIGPRRFRALDRGAEAGAASHGWRAEPPRARTALGGDPEAGAASVCPGLPPRRAASRNGVTRPTGAPPRGRTPPHSTTLQGDYTGFFY